MYYLDFTIPTGIGGIANTQEITFPSMPLNIKANNALISIDKMQMDGSTNVAFPGNFAILVQTTIPTANHFTGALEGQTNPRSVPYGETIMLKSEIKDHVNGADLTIGSLMYVNSNPQRQMVCANPFGNAYTLSFYNHNPATGIRELNNDLDQVILLTFRVELLQEEIK